MVSLLPVDDPDGSGKGGYAAGEDGVKYPYRHVPVGPSPCPAATYSPAVPPPPPHRKPASLGSWHDGAAGRSAARVCVVCVAWGWGWGGVGWGGIRAVRLLLLLLPRRLRLRRGLRITMYVSCGE